MNRHSTPVPSAVRRVVSLAIRCPEDPGRVLVVRRPDDDPDLPGVWGLPAGRIREGEGRRNSVQRIGLEKLGVGVEPGALLNHGRTRRREYHLEMELVDARLMEGKPMVPQGHHGITQYTEWRWGCGVDLEPAAALGSLCCRLFLEAEPPSRPAGG
ncbi:MAG: NUDIX domain-containing protein [Gemmatimonadota bacterium]